jgi:hypothetical protein
VLRSRIFWVGRRLYHVSVGHVPEFLNARAADSFLESFRIEIERPTDPPEPAAMPDGGGEQ